jgi:hypothetical protein
MKPISLLILIGLCFFPFAVNAEIYKWTDDQGVVHYTDDHKNIPAKYLDQAVDFDKTEPGGSVTYDPSPVAPTVDKSGEEPFYKRFLRTLEEERIQRAAVARKPNVTLYMTDW